MYIYIQISIHRKCDAMARTRHGVPSALPGSGPVPRCPSARTREKCAWAAQVRDPTVRKWLYGTINHSLWMFMGLKHPMKRIF